MGEQLNTSHPWMLLFIVTRPPPQSLFQKKRQNKPPLKAFHCFPCFKKSGRAEGLGETWPFPRSRRYLAPVMLCFFAWPLRATNAAPQRRAGLSLGLGSHVRRTRSNSHSDGYIKSFHSVPCQEQPISPHGERPSP